MPHALALWQDRRGNLSWLRVATLAVLVFPAGLALFDFSRNALGGRPLNEVIHRTGWWALVFLLASLAVTPLRRAGRFAKLIDVRRMIGVAAFAYAAIHLGLYITDQNFNLVKVATEIVSRIYLTIGFVALLGLAALAITSNDTMVKKLGGLRWRQLHQVAYLITVLALVHYFQQTKADVSVPMAYAGVFGWMMAYRFLARWRGEDALGPLALLSLAFAVSLLTFAAEAMFIALKFGQPVLDFLPLYFATVFDPSLGIRPGWWVLLAGVLVAALETVRGLMERRTMASRRPAMVRTS